MASEPQPKIVPVHGDMGIGMCLACCNEYAAGKRTVTPEFAITMAPMPVPGGLLMVPACFEHLQWLIATAGKSPLIISGMS